MAEMVTVEHVPIDVALAFAIGKLEDKIYFLPYQRPHYSQEQLIIKTKQYNDRIADLNKILHQRKYNANHSPATRR